MGVRSSGQFVDPPGLIISLWPHEGEDQQRRLFCYLHEGFQQLERSRIRPVEVVDDDDEWPFLGCSGDHLDDRREHPLAEDRRFEELECLAFLGRRRYAEKRGEIGHDFG